MAEKSKGGAPTKYRDDIPQKLLDYFSTITTITIMGKEYPRFNSVEGFCAQTGIAKVTFYEWIKKHDALANAFKRCKNYQADQLFNLTANRLFSESYGKLLTVNCTDMKDKIESKEESNQTIELNYKQK